MAYLQPTTEAGLWIIPGIELSGVTQLGDATGISNDMTAITGEGEAACLAAAQDSPTVVGYRPLPAAGRMGGWCSVQGGGYGDVSVQTIPLPTSAYLTGGMDADCCTRIVAGGPLISIISIMEPPCTYRLPTTTRPTATAPYAGGRGNG